MQLGGPQLISALADSGLSNRWHTPFLTLPSISSTLESKPGHILLPMNCAYSVFCRDFLLIILPPVSWREKNTELGLRGVQIQKKSWRKSECLRLGRYHAQAHGLGLPA